MGKDSTLDSFSGGGEDAGDETGETDASDTENADEQATKAVSPATSTYAWSPDGAACGSCGEVVARRWRDGDDLVCESCKSW